MHPIRPEVEELVRRRAAASAVRQPRRRLVAVSGMGVAATALCATLLLTLGSPAQSGLLSPERAVAAVSKSLDGSGVLHWVRRGDLVTDAASEDRPGALVEEQWIDLSTGDSHTSTTSSRAGQPSRTNESWVASGHLWQAVPAGVGGAPAIRQIPDPASTSTTPGPFTPITSVEDVRAMLQRAERGEAEVADAGEDSGVPLVMVTDRDDGGTLQTFITREANPRVVKVIATVSSGAGTPITTTTTTQTWEVLPRTATALTQIALPAGATRAR